MEGPSIIPVAVLGITAVDNKVKSFSLSAPQKLKDIVDEKTLPDYKFKPGIASSYVSDDWTLALDVYEMIGLIEESGYILEHFSAASGGSMRCLFRSTERLEV